MPQCVMNSRRRAVQTASDHLNRLDMNYSFPRIIRVVLGLSCLAGIGCTEDGLSTENNSIRFTSTPPMSVDHNALYRHEIEVANDQNKALTLTVVRQPDWLHFDANESVLSGEAGWDNIGEHLVEIEASDGMQIKRQAFTLTVTMGKVICNQDFGDPAQSLYSLPIKVGTTSTIIQSYCRVRTGGPHDTFAYDFELAMGDTIYAARDGLAYRVQESYQDGNGVPGRENFVYVEHADGTVIRYVHLMHNGALVTPGTQVAAGQAIGLNGLTGATSSPHLHFEMFRSRDFSGKPIDVLKAMSLPVNFRNAEGPLDANRGLVEGARYRALPYE